MFQDSIKYAWHFQTLNYGTTGKVDIESDDDAYANKRYKIWNNSLLMVI